MPTHHPFTVALVASACLVALPARAATPAAAAEGTPSVESRMPEADRDFMRSAAQAGRAEVEAGRIALQKASDPAVKDFAQKMIDDHTQAGEKLQRLAASKGVELPAEPAAADRGRIAWAKTAAAADFDRRYVETFAVEAHRDAVARFRKEADRGRDADVKAFARELLPKLEEHLTIAESLRSRIESASRESSAAGESRAAQEEIDRAVQVAQQMKSDPRMAALLADAKGVFILPRHGSGALGVGIEAGEGVLVTRAGEGFGNPVFYELGGVSFGAQAGGAGGPVAMLLMSERAVEKFGSGQRFSLDADAGLTFVDYSKRAQASTGKVRDVVVWSAEKGAYAGVAVGVKGITPDREANQSYYGRPIADPAEIIEGRVENPRHNVLGMVLRV